MLMRDTPTDDIVGRRHEDTGGRAAPWFRDQESFELEPLPMHIPYAERKPVPLKLRAFPNWVAPRLKARLT
jgi:hypothetical protein